MREIAVSQASQMFEAGIQQKNPKWFWITAEQIS
jgi:hypothetical protein